MKSFLKTVSHGFTATPAYYSKSKDKHILHLAQSLKTSSTFQKICDPVYYLSLTYYD